MRISNGDEYGRRIGSELRATTSDLATPPTLRARVDDRTRHHRHRRVTVRAGALGVAATATLGGLAWTAQTRSTSEAPASHPRTLTPSPAADRIDAYPIVDLRGVSIDGVGASYGVHDDDQGWFGTVGVLDSSGTPRVIVAIHAFPVGYRFPGDGSPIPDARPGQVAGVRELRGRNGTTTLTRQVDGAWLTMVGDDATVMYDLIDLVEPMATTPTRGGYRFTAPLPAGLVELETPYHAVPMRTPSVGTDDGTFGVTVLDGPLLARLAPGGGAGLDPIVINGVHGYRATIGDPTIALALSTDETLYLSTTTMTLQQITDIAARITLTDEATWRAHYAIDSRDQVGPTTTTTQASSSPIDGRAAPLESALLAPAGNWAVAERP